MDGESSRIYQFADFRLISSEHILEYRGRIIYLRPKTFDTLLYLIEHQGHLVKKSELLDRVWADTVVTEGALTQCIKEIRAALNDHAANPRFIKTVPRMGYKFIAEVRIVDDEGEQRLSAGELIGSAAQAASLSEVVAGGKRGRARYRLGYIVAAFSIGLVALLLFFLFSRTPALTFSERDWVLVGDFTNYTQQEVFAAALRTALERELSRSRYVNVVSRGRVLDVLRLMKRDPGSIIDQNLGREICLRDGNIRVLLSGSIQEIGGNYEISVKLIDPANGRLVATLAEEAGSEKQVLPAMRRLAREVRKKLGESLSSILRTEQRLVQVTTPSLKALALYSKGWQFANQLDWRKARSFLEQAVATDSTFAMAHMVLGYAYYWLGEMPQALNCFSRAKKYMAGVSDREKYFILGTYAYHNLQDLQKAIDSYEILVELYPDDFWGHQNLSVIYMLRQDWKNSLLHKKECTRIRPNYPVIHSDLGLYSLFMKGDLKTAHEEFSRALDLNPDFPYEFPHLSAGFMKWMQGDLDGAESHFSTFLTQRLKRLLPPFQITARWLVARFYLFRRDYRKAMQLLTAALREADIQGNQNLLAWTRLELALVNLEIGNFEEFRRLLKQIAEESVGLVRVEALGWLGIFEARNGEIQPARRYLQALLQERRTMPVDFFHPPLPDELARAQRAFRLQIFGEIALARGDTGRAMVYFETVGRQVGPSQLPALSALNSQLYLVAHQRLAAIFLQRRNWEAARKLLQSIRAVKHLVILVPAASGMWLDTEAKLAALDRQISRER